MPPTNEEKLLAELGEKLDVLIKVVCIQVGEDKSTTERARLLKLAGVDNQTIALVLNTSVQVVRTLTLNLREKGTLMMKEERISSLERVERLLALLLLQNMSSPQTPLRKLASLALQGSQMLKSRILLETTAAVVGQSLICGTKREKEEVDSYASRP